MRDSKFSKTWVAIWVVPMAIQLLLLRVLGATGTFESPNALFWIVTIAASFCVVPSTLLIIAAARTRAIELSFVGLFYLAVSILPLVHGLTTPGVLVGDNTTTMTSVLWSIPVGVIFGSPMLLPMRWQRRLVPKYWKQWTLGCIALLVLFAAGLLIDQNLLTLHEPGSPFAIFVATLSILGCIALSVRGLQLARIAQRPGPLAPAVGYAFVGASAAVWFGTSMFSVGFWAAHALDIAGVFVGTIGALIMLRRTGSLQDLIAPALASDPLAALEIGLEPIVHRYISDLAAKDQITRDHVVRTCELAVLVAEELGFHGSSLRHIGMVGLLHDVGKLEIPDGVLNKPGKLTDDEFAIIKSHPLAGERLVLESPVLRHLAAGVRGHHERIDGNGYPDRLAGADIPLEARIVSACDAYDAMANTRQYRKGMGREKAVSILREHAGSQWDAAVVAALIAVTARHEVVVEDSPLASVGQHGNHDAPSVGCDCLPEFAEAAA